MTDIRSTLPMPVTIDIGTSATIRHLEERAAREPEMANAMSVAVSLSAVAHQARVMGLRALAMHIAGLAHAAYNGDAVMTVNSPMGEDDSPCQICKQVYGLKETCRCMKTKRS